MDLIVAPENVPILSELASRYLWWEPTEGHVHSVPRKIAQIMHLGTYADIRRLEALVQAAGLAAVMRQSQPGWFDDRSWSFWRGRLTASGEMDIPGHRPMRSFVDAALL